MSVYTRKGDQGKTSMFEPDLKKRGTVSKSSVRVQAIGAVDELNSYLGVANVYCKNPETVAFIKLVQRDLFTIGSILSKAPQELSHERVTALEKKIDEIDETLPPLKNFLMPEGCESAVHFMYARTIARRAERRVVSLNHQSSVPEVILQYLNRLSDFLFILFRDENMRSEEPMHIWIGKRD